VRKLPAEDDRFRLAGTAEGGIWLTRMPHGVPRGCAAAGKRHAGRLGCPAGKRHARRLGCPAGKRHARRLGCAAGKRHARRLGCAAGKRHAGRLGADC